jgi:hypothetical protein
MLYATSDDRENSIAHGEPDADGEAHCPTDKERNSAARDRKNGSVIAKLRVMLEI